MRHGSHCPFLNRSDPRCAEYLRLGSLAHAFHHCWNEYGACPVYCELLSQRRGRRPAEMKAVHDEPANVIVQVNVSRRIARPEPATA